MYQTVQRHSADSILLQDFHGTHASQARWWKEKCSNCACCNHIILSHFDERWNSWCDISVVETAVPNRMMLWFLLSCFSADTWLWFFRGRKCWVHLWVSWLVGVWRYIRPFWRLCWVFVEGWTLLCWFLGYLDMATASDENSSFPWHSFWQCNIYDLTVWCPIWCHQSDFRWVSRHVKHVWISTDLVCTLLILWFKAWCVFVSGILWMSLISARFLSSLDIWDRNFQYPLRGSFGHDSSVVVGQGTLSQIVVVRLQDVSMSLDTERCQADRTEVEIK